MAKVKPEEKKTQSVKTKKANTKAKVEATAAPAVKRAASDKSAKKKAPKAAKPSKPCKVQSCKRTYRAKGYCKTHYRLWRHGKYGRARYKICQDINCQKPMAMNRHGFCEEHYQSYYVKGVAQAKAPAAPAAAPKPDSKVAAA